MKPLLCLIGVFLSVLPICRAAPAAFDLKELQNLSNKWVQLRAETTKIESEWRWKKEIFESSIGALEQKKEQLVQVKKDLDASLRLQQQQLEEAKTYNEKLRQHHQQTSEVLAELTQQLISARAKLPPKLNASLEQSFLSLENVAYTEGEKFQILANALTRILQFNHVITVSREIVVVDQGDGTPDQEKVLDVIYWGLSHAYAYDETKAVAYHGIPENLSWKWNQIDDSGSGENVRSLFAVFREELDPKMISLPVKLSALSNEEVEH